MANPLTNLERLRLVIELERMRRSVVPREAVIAMAEALQEAVMLHDGPEPFSAADILESYRDRLKAAGFK